MEIPQMLFWKNDISEKVTALRRNISTRYLNSSVAALTVEFLNALQTAWLNDNNWTEDRLKTLLDQLAGFMDQDLLSILSGLITNYGGYAAMQEDLTRARRLFDLLKNVDISTLTQESAIALIAEYE